MTDRVAELLQQLVAEVRGLRADFRRQNIGDRLRAADDAWTSSLLSELLAVRARDFVAADVLAYADGRPTLFALISPYLGEEGAQALGLRLRRCSNKPTSGGLVLVRLSKSEGVALYRVGDLGDLEGPNPPLRS